MWGSRARLPYERYTFTPPWSCVVVDKRRPYVHILLKNMHTYESKECNNLRIEGSLCG
jgi:hypothetical protein